MQIKHLSTFLTLMQIKSISTFMTLMQIKRLSTFLAIMQIKPVTTFLTLIQIKSISTFLTLLQIKFMSTSNANENPCLAFWLSCKPNLYLHFHCLSKQHNWPLKSWKYFRCRKTNETKSFVALCLLKINRLRSILNFVIDIVKQVQGRCFTNNMIFRSWRPMMKEFVWIKSIGRCLGARQRGSMKRENKLYTDIRLIYNDLYQHYYNTLCSCGIDNICGISPL